MQHRVSMWWVGVEIFSYKKAAVSTFFHCSFSALQVLSTIKLQIEQNLSFAHY